MNLRSEREALAQLGLTDADILHAQTAMRKPGTSNTEIQRLLSTRLKKSGGSMATFLKAVSRDLKEREFIDWRAFK